jgi:hypothetical protein
MNGWLSVNRHQSPISYRCPNLKLVPANRNRNSPSGNRLKPATAASVGITPREGLTITALFLKAVSLRSTTSPRSRSSTMARTSGWPKSASRAPLWSHGKATACPIRGVTTRKMGCMLVLRRESRRCDGRFSIKPRSLEIVQCCNL